MDFDDTNIEDICPTSGTTTLHKYCECINTTSLAVFKNLIETRCVDVNVLDKHGNTPLHYALRHFDPNEGGDITVLNYLLNQKNVDVNIKGQYGFTLLHYACQKINSLPLEIYQYLIETMGCDINLQDKHRNTPLHSAIYRFDPTNDGNIPTLHYLLNQNGADVNIKGQFGYTLLHLACKKIDYFSFEVFQCLIETHGGDVNIQDNNNDTPLHLATYHFNPTEEGGNFTTLTYLLSQENTNINIKGQYGYTLLHRACQRINALPIEIFQCLIETMGCDVNVQDDKKDTPFHYAIRQFYPNGINIAALHYLFNQKNVDVKIKGQYGYTLLHIACQKINSLPIDVFKLLIDKMGCDVNVQDSKKNTPLHSAIRPFDQDYGGDITTLYYLFSQKSVNVDIKGEYGYTLLHYLCRKISSLPFDIFKLLIEMGCDLNARDDHNSTPIQFALELFQPVDTDDHTSAALTYLLTQHNVNVNTANQPGETLLHAVCKHINVLPLDVFKFLIETKGCDVNALDSEHITPIQVAIQKFNPKYGNITVLTYFLAQDSTDVSIRDKRGRNLLHLACIDLSNCMGSMELKAEADASLCQIVGVVIEKCIEQVVDATTSL